MEIVNKIKDGLHIDNNVYDQPNNTMRDNINGVITDIGNGYFKWSNIKGNTFSFSLGVLDKYMAHCLINTRLFIITLDELANIVRFYEITFPNNIGTATVKYSISNTILNLSYLWPIRTIFGFYENEETQRIYFSDYHNQPRVINMGTPGTTITLNPKFLNFFPTIDNNYGRFTGSSISCGGSLKAGTYFFAWRFYTNDGYFTDWSYITNPIQITSGATSDSYESYQNYEGRAPDFNTGNKLSIILEDLDTDYENIQVCAFYSNDFNIVEPAVIFFDGSLSASIMTFEYTGSENAGTVSIDDLVETSIKIDLIKDMVAARKQNVVGNIKERPDLDLDASINVDISVEINHIPLDTSGYTGAMTSAGDIKSLHQLYRASRDEAVPLLRRGQWYRATTALSYSIGLGNVVVPQGNLFYISESATTVSLIYGTFKAIVVVKKYLRAGGVSGGDINTNYVFEYEDLDDDYYDWKSHKVTKKYKSYPQGEKVRLGVLFFDKTGRPFMVRHLYNTNLTYGTGDTSIPKRSNTNPLLAYGGFVATAPDGFYMEASARLQHLKVSGIDITDIASEIGGFMIVRAPIEHQYLGMGLLLPTYLNGNDVFCYPGFFSAAGPAEKHRGCYAFYCPEDLLNFKGFTIQKDDEIENIMYLAPYNRSEVTILSGSYLEVFQGLGKRESNENVDLYQKFYITDNGAITITNGDPGISHRVVNVTKYTLGDNDLPIDPLDSTKLYQALSYDAFDGFGVHHGYNSNHSVLILDIPDDLIDNKACYTAVSSPRALLCAVKRTNINPYGGSSDSSYANTVYMSTGHYQEINDTVLADILQGGRYIFNDIDIYGGDTFVELFDLKRLYRNYDLPADEGLGHSVIFPVESRMNIGLREGNHVSKNRSFDSLYNTGGLKLEVGATLLEEFNYNDGYSTDNISDLYLPVPFKYKNITDLKSRIRYSHEKNYGELRDSFRRFGANDFIDIDINKGEITNIRYKNNRLIYWQPDEVGYIPLQERALTQNSIGQPVQLGVGGLFERYDQLIDKIGNCHQFGLIESPNGYHWYDARRKIFISIGFNLQLSLDSIVKGCDKFFQENITDDFDSSDNPFIDTLNGIIGGYDPMSKMLFITFSNSYVANRIAGTERVVRYDVKYGPLYNWFVVSDPRNIAAAGWHVSTTDDLWDLMRAIDPDGDFPVPTNDAAYKLREAGIVHWDVATGTNNYGFNARGGGQRDPSTGEFGFQKLGSYYWTPTDIGGGYVAISWINAYDGMFMLSKTGGPWQASLKTAGRSIRLVKDSTTLTNGQTGTYIGNDGKIYPTVCVGTKEYVACDLAETLFRTREAIPIETDNATWAALATSAMCHYENNADNSITEVVLSEYSPEVITYGNTKKTIGIHSILNKFIGKYDIYPGAYLTLKDHLYEFSSGLVNAYVHGTGQYCMFFGNQYQALVSIVVKEDSNEEKIFDTLELIGNENFFNKILYNNSSQLIEETVATYPPFAISNRNYERRKKRWFANFPKVSRERLNDGYLIITFKIDYPYLVELYELKSNVRKFY